MIELADIFRQHGDAYLEQYADKMLPSHKKAMQDIQNCRTPVLGGEIWHCDSCDQDVYSYHSCGNRHCPKCESDRADKWRNKQMLKMLPVTYFLVTFTLPHTLNPFARSNQKLFYNLLFKSSAEALITLAKDPKFAGGTIGMIGVLHTWDRSMGYHLHIHYLVPGIGIDKKNRIWNKTSPKFLVYVHTLKKIYRAKFRDELKKSAPIIFKQIPKVTWKKNWSVNCQPVGDGQTALKYLTAYIYRVAISNKRIISIDNGKVTFRYKPNDKPWQTMTIDALKFISRFLLHVLPRGFQKVRYFGFLHPSQKELFQALQIHLMLKQTNVSVTNFEKNKELKPETEPAIITTRCCPHCGEPLRYIGILYRNQLIREPP